MGEEAFEFFISAIAHNPNLTVFLLLLTYPNFLSLTLPLFIVEVNALKFKDLVKLIQSAIHNIEDLFDELNRRLVLNNNIKELKNDVIVKAEIQKEESQDTRKEIKKHINEKIDKIDEEGKKI